MEPQTLVAVSIVGALAAWAAWYGARAFGVWRRLRGDRIVTCPETGHPAAVRVDIARAVTTDRGGQIPLESCSRWAERGACDQPCAFAAQAPEASASALVHEWAGTRTCMQCGVPLLASESSGHHLALLEPDGVSREWVDIAADRLPAALAGSQPICWNCHIAETFRREHPELVTDRETSATHVSATARS